MPSLADKPQCEYTVVLFRKKNVLCGVSLETPQRTFFLGPSKWEIQARDPPTEDAATEITAAVQSGISLPSEKSGRGGRNVSSFTVAR